MQKYLLLLFLCLFAWQLPAQVSLEPQQVIVSGVSPDSTQAIGYGRVKNNADETRTYRWVRTIRSLSEGWETAVCDTNLCYLPFVDSMEFDLSAQLEANLNVYVYPNELEGSAIVEVKVVDVNNPEYTANAVYYFNDTPSSLRKKTSYSKLQVYPNPTRNIFQVSDNEIVGQVVLFNLLGRQLKTFSYIPGDLYRLDYLPKGTYLVQLRDRQGQTLVTRILNKL
jgi:hypothetical protein